MLKTRYTFLKKLYSEYLIIFYRNKTFLTFDIDRKIEKMIKEKNQEFVKTLEKHHINYIILDNLNVIKKKNFQDNCYLEFCEKVKLFDMCLKIYNEYNKKKEKKEE